MSDSQDIKLPSDKVLKNATKLSIEQDKPIMLDYWQDSYGDSNVLIGVRTNDEKMLVRSAEEYTSPISKILKLPRNISLLPKILFTLLAQKFQPKEFLKRL